jgi:glycosyltransferase involved in cell wall biosynthesis
VLRTDQGDVAKLGVARLRIVQLAQKPQRRGAEVFAFQLSEELRRQGHQVHTAYLYPYSQEGGLPVDANGCVLGEKGSHPLEKVPGFQPRILWRLLRLIQEVEPQVLQVNGARTVKYGAFARLFSRQDSWVLIYRNIGDPNDWIRSAPYRLFYRYLVMPQVDGVVGVSEATLQAVTEFHGLTVPRVSVPTGVSPAGLVPSLSREAARQQLETPPEAPVILFVGSLTPEKRLDRLLRVFRRVHDALPSLRLWLVGDGPLRPEVEDDFRACGLSGQVIFLGLQANVATFMSAADVLLLTSDTEGIPGVVLEAGLLGLPVVATRVGGLPEAVLDGQTGFLRPPQDEEGLARAVLDLLGDRQLRSEMSRLSRRWIRERFTMDSIARRYTGFYRRVLLEIQGAGEEIGPVGTGRDSR